MMFHRILVPLDGSKRAERALPAAARIAQATQGTLIVVQAIDIDLALLAVPGMILTDADIRAEQDTAMQYLTQITLPFQQKGLSIEKVAESGRTIPLLLSAVMSHHADLVVMCGHRRTGFSRWALGSIAESIADGCAVPTLILHEHGPIPGGPHPDPTRPLRILVPLDGSEVALSVLDPATSLIAALAAPGQGALHMVRVIQPPANEQVGVSSFKQRMQHAKRSLSRVVENIRCGVAAPSVVPLDMRITYSVASDQDVAHAILRVAEQGEDTEGCGVFGGCDVIAMATHGRTGLDYLALGSVTKHVLHATKLPVLIVRPALMKDQQTIHTITEDAALKPHYTISGID